MSQPTAVLGSERRGLGGRDRVRPEDSTSDAAPAAEPPAKFVPPADASRALFHRKGRPRNLRAKAAGQAREGADAAADERVSALLEEEDQEEAAAAAEAEERELAQMRQSIAAVRLREANRAADHARSGGGVPRPWAQDGFIQWRSSEPQAGGVMPDKDAAPHPPPEAEDCSGVAPEPCITAAEDRASPTCITCGGGPDTCPWTRAGDHHAGSTGGDAGASPRGQAAAAQAWQEVAPAVADQLAALGLKAVMTPDMGRTLVATRAFSPGDVILEEEPLAWALEGDGGSARGRAASVLGPDAVVYDAVRVPWLW